MQALTSVLGGVTGTIVPTAAPLATTGQSAIRRFFSAGFEVGFLGLLFLAGGFLIPPFNALGILGVNLLAVGSTAFGFLKAAVGAAIPFAVKYLKLYYPGLWPVIFMIGLNPWFVHDIIQTWSPTFAAEGYKIPFVGRALGGRGDDGPKGRVTPVVVGAIIGAFAYGGYTLLDYLPKEVVGQTGPLLQKIFLWVGGLTALTGGGMTALVALPEIMAAMKETMATPATPATPAAPVQAGGSAKPRVPSLEEIAKGILQKGSGSGSDASSSTALAPLFLGGLATIVLGGVTLAVTRNRVASITETE